MIYCKKCVQPNTRPGIFLNKEGVCSACIGHEEKKSKIDWLKRKNELVEILEKYKRKNYYDCIVPVSGGKDSTYQIYTMKNTFDMNPLGVTYRYNDQTEIGKENLDNLRMLGFDHLQFTPNPNVERKFVKKTLIQDGDPNIVSHLGCFAFPLKIAIELNIPLIIWGENPELEYGGKAADRNNPFLDNEWLKKHGCLNGKTAEDWIDDDLTLKEIAMYRFPEDEELRKAKVTSIFLGYYVKWDPVDNFNISSKLGFKKHPDGPRLGLYDFADLDSTDIIIHHYIKLLKYGMSRLNDNISTEIRNARMTREEGIKILMSKPERFPEEEVNIMCQNLSLTREEFWKILEKFRNPDIWKKNENGQWYIPGFLGRID